MITMESSFIFKVELILLTKIGMLLMIEKGIRDGICHAIY